MGQENRFGEFISNLRIEKGISLEQLSDGLCDFSLLSRFERGEREPEKLLQNRFLTRLGTVPENYENFLYHKEYCRWEKRQGIIHNILEENIKEAKRLLEEYRQEYDMNYSLEKQFYLAMLAQIRRYEGCGNEELAKIFEEALELTVPDINVRSFRNRILSLEELNLLLEYRYCNSDGISLQFYETLLEYIERMEQTMLAMAKIYPKTVYYYFDAWKKSGEPKECRAEHMMELCDKAIELLRNANRMFYLWELFCMKEELTPALPESVQKEADFVKHLEECRNWRETLEELYQEYHVSIAMYEFCYLYVESENYCIGDVIRIRRKMLGLSQEKLCKGICDSRTVSRLEHNSRKPQKEIVQQLFERLNLSTELCRTELVTDNPEAVKKYKELVFKNNYLAHKHAKGCSEPIRKELTALISREIPSNEQLLLRNEIIVKYNNGEIDKEEYVSCMKRALECTVPFEAVISKGEKYLTNEEIGCLQNITSKMDKKCEDMRKCITVLKKICEQPRYPINYLRMYEFVMAAVSSYFGNCGDYEQSDEIKNTLIELLLKSRKICGIHEALYGITWNEEQRNKKSIEFDGTYKLKRCLSISALCRDQERNTMYEEKIKKRGTERS